MFGPVGLVQKIVGGVALGLIALLFLGYQIEKRQAHKWEAQAVKANAELHRISTAKNDQKAETKVRIVKAEEGMKSAERMAKRIEEAPVSGQCQTPEAVLSADL